METTVKKINSLADSQEPIVRVPVIVKVVQVKLTLAVPLVDIWHVAIAIRRLPILCNAPPKPPPVKYFSGCIVFGI